MAKRHYMNESDSSNNCPPSKKQKLSNLNEEKKEIEQVHETVSFEFKADDMINNEPQMVDQLDLQKVLFANLLFHTLKTAGISNGEIEACITLLFEKMYHIKVNVVIHPDEAFAIQNDESEDDDDDLDDVDAGDDLDEEISQTPEAERCSANSDDEEFINNEGDDNEHMIDSDEDCEETYEAGDDSSHSSSSSNSHQTEESSSRAF